MSLLVCMYYIVLFHVCTLHCTVVILYKQCPPVQSNDLLDMQEEHKENKQ